MILLRNVKKKFPNFTLDINFDINKGEILGILGESGSGKSTILKLMKNIVKMDSGEIIFGEEIESSYIFQEFNLLYNQDVFNNVALPLKLNRKYSKGEIEKRVVENLSFVNLLEKKRENISTLSGGQKQRVAIARALVTQPKLLLCDEITSSLDENMTNDILDLLKKINKTYNTTILLVTHELDVIRKICDRVILIDRGSVVDDFEITKEKYDFDKKHYVEYVREVLK